MFDSIHKRFLMSFLFLSSNMDAMRLSFLSLSFGDKLSIIIFLFHRFEELLKSVLGDGDNPRVMGQSAWRKRKAQSLGESKVQQA